MSLFLGSFDNQNAILGNVWPIPVLAKIGNLSKQIQQLHTCSVVNVLTGFSEEI